MRKIHFIMISCLLLFTCQTDMENDTEEQNIETEITTAEKNRIPTTRPVNNDFEIKLQWASYVIAKIYQQDEDARKEILNHLEDDTVSLEQLIDRRSPSSSFYKAFFEELLYYYQNGKKPTPEDEEETPPGDIAVCCSLPPGSTLRPDNFIVNRYIDYLTLDNCVELYFPNKAIIKPKGIITHITSTAHPLTNADYNYGYWRYQHPITYPDGFYGIAHEIIVDDEFVVNEGQGFVLVARPIKKLTDPDCSYKEYDVKDFRLFLD